MEKDTEKEYKSFSEFYPSYLSEHGDRLNRRLHFTGLLLALLILIFVLFTQDWILLLLVPIFGYGFAWLGHYFIEKNKPTTFKYPLYSILGDLAMFKDIITGKIKL